MKKGLLIIALFAIIVGIVAFIYTRGSKAPQLTASPTPTPYNLPTVNSWKGIVPGSSTTQDLVTKLGASSPGTQSGAITTYTFPSANQYWKNEVDVENNTVSFIRERIFAPSDVSYKSLAATLKESPIKLYGPDSQSGTYLFLYPQEGVAYLTNSFQNTVYQVWRFSPTAVDGFLSLPQAAGYSITLAGQPE